MYEKESEEIIGMCSAVFMHEYLEQDIIELKKKIANKLDLIVAENIQGECLECEYNPDRLTEPLDMNDLD